MARGMSNGPMNNMPHSPRQQSRTQRGGSRKDNFQGSNAKQEAQAAKTMPLTAGMELKPIQVTASGWKPRSVGQSQSATGAAGPTPGSSGATGHMEPDLVQRKVKAALNKMTPEKFDKIADQILAIAAQSKDEADGRTLRQVIQLTFEKATDEAHWASMYAKFCKRMLETMSPEIKDESITDKNGNIVSGGNLFRKYLLNRCQEEFERGWKMDLPEKPEGEREDAKTEEAAMLSDEYYVAATAKRRGLGLVQFIGELYKLSMLTERIMHECVKKLVDYTGIPDEAEIESLTKLLKTIGSNLDSTEKGKPMMDVYFQRIQSMIDTPELPSRLRFMLMFNIASTLLTFHRPRQLPTRRLPRIMPVAVSAEADVCKWDGAIHEISPINITNLLSTTRRILSVWMTSVVSPIRMPAGLPASRCRLVQHPCSHRAATAVARWVPVAH